jgi:hypothetical protein
MEVVAWSAIGVLAASQLGMLFYLGSRIDALGARLDGRIDALASRIDAQTSRIDALTSRVAEQGEQLGLLTARMDNHLGGPAG